MGPRWPRACSAPTRSTPSWATACRPSWCSASPAPPSTRRPPPSPSSCSPATSARSCPVLFLRLRAAAVDGDLSIVELSPQATSLTAHAAVSLRYGPGDAAALVGALVADGTPPDAAKDADALAEARRLLGDGPVVVVVGRPSLAEDGELVADAARTLADALPEARFLPALRRGNVHRRPRHGARPRRPARPGLTRRRTGLVRGGLGIGAGGRGRGTADILAAAAGDQAEGAPVTALVLLGSDPLTDFPDRRLARRALEGAGFVVAVATAPGEVLEHADVVLPAAEAHERPGTTTNIEGRISRVGQKLVPPGQAWPDWMIAGELAVHLGHDLAFDSVGDVWDEIERVAVSHRGITRTVLDSPAAADGVVAPLSSSPVSLSHRVTPLDPMAVPGIESVERQGTSLQAGLAVVAQCRRARPRPGARAAGATRPTMLAGSPDLTFPTSPRPTATRSGWWPPGSSTTTGCRPGRSGARRSGRDRIAARQSARPRRPRR